MQCSVVLIIISCTIARSEFYDTYSGKEIDRVRYEELNRLGLVPYCALEVAPCHPHERRRMDGSCNNLKYPPQGATLTPYRRLLSPIFSAGGNLRTARSGKPLPLVRPLRVALMSDGRIPSDKYTQMVVNYNVFVTGDITSVHDTTNYVALTRTCCQPEGRTDPRCIPVEVLDNDLHLRRSNVRCMNLTRAITYQRLGCVSDEQQQERINTAAALLDLSVVYGHEGGRARLGRQNSGGRMKSEVLEGKEWPPSGGSVCVNNVPPRETRCHDSPTLGGNSILGLNLLLIWMYRSHNAIARQLEQFNPCWIDDELFTTAKEINIAYYNQILYYELMAELLGWEFLVKSKVLYPTVGHVDDYDPTLEPRTSIEYIIATRWFHTLQEGRIKLYTADGRQYQEVAVVDFTLRTGALPLNNTIAGVTRGVYRQQGGGGGRIVDPDIGERVLGRLQLASDVLSSDLMKGRDVGLPPYNRYRQLCGLPVAKTFHDLLGWMDVTQVEAMASFYEHPDDIDLFAALLAERAMPGAAMGPTLVCIMAEQLFYWRRSDRFWYEHPDHPGAFTKDQLFEIRKMTLSKLLCLHGDGVDAVQPNAFLLAGPRNEMTKCSEYEMPNLNVFRDDRCYPKATPIHTNANHPTSTNQDQEKLHQTIPSSFNPGYTYPNIFSSTANNYKHPRINFQDYIEEYNPKESMYQGFNNPKVAAYFNNNPLLDKYGYNNGFSNVNPFQEFIKYG